MGVSVGDVDTLMPHTLCNSQGSKAHVDQQTDVLLSWEEVEKFRARGANVADGAFGENLLVKGYEFKSYPVGSNI